MILLHFRRYGIKSWILFHSFIQMIWIFLVMIIYKFDQSDQSYETFQVIALIALKAKGDVWNRDCELMEIYAKIRKESKDEPKYGCTQLAALDLRLASRPLIACYAHWQIVYQKRFFVRLVLMSVHTCVRRMNFASDVYHLWMYISAAISQSLKLFGYCYFEKLCKYNLYATLHMRFLSFS